MERVVTADCQPYQLIAGQPINSGLTKESGYSPTASGADFYASFLADPAVHLRRAIGRLPPAPRSSGSQATRAAISRPMIGAPR